ncbi:MAG: fructosamine kinase family protein [Gammaproteobacteria bacterium]|jgi:protein-ribulosamine 3-kinase|nr:fructosamine kinase family protein [Gammaproteobacteria bacterium]MBT7307731.1 fructosamine kinase family protein [Gammaproteobacteria bacterium]
MQTTLRAVTRQLANHYQSGLEYQSHQPLHGGDINQSFLLQTRQGEYFFIKLNKASRLSMFEAESAALMAMQQTDTIRVPTPLLTGTVTPYAFLVLEFIEMSAATPASEAKLGHQLAAMHHVTATQFGWNRANTIGTTPQHNTLTSSWATFWREQRIAPQLQRAAHRRGGDTLQLRGELLLSSIDKLLQAHHPAPSMLHGDLWGGNWSTTPDGKPLLYDPALYYGDRETDLAMSELFGGFSSHFYQAYNEHYPLDEGYHRRKVCYNLYHILNHFNLFGGVYGQQAEQMVDTLLHHNTP